MNPSAADQFAYEAGRAGKVGGFATRRRDYQFQSNAAAGEITQLFKQLRASEIRGAMAKRELENHRIQMEQSQKIKAFLKDKTTNQNLYTWMKREVKGLYGKSFQFAFDVSKKTEPSSRNWVTPTFPILRSAIWRGKRDSWPGKNCIKTSRNGDGVRRAESARIYELTKHVSLVQINPLALLQLRSTGSCVPPFHSLKKCLTLIALDIISGESGR